MSEASIFPGLFMPLMSRVTMFGVPMHGNRMNLNLDFTLRLYGFHASRAHVFFMT